LSIRTAINWLNKTFGFVERHRYGEPNGAVSGAQMHLADAWIMVKAAKPNASSPAQLGYGTQSLTVFVNDVDAHFGKVKIDRRTYCRAASRDRIW
jgi:uncharacterized glyoxalase superfamily protein PhnB